LFKHCKIVKNERGEVIFGENVKDAPTGFSVKTQRSPIEEFEKKSLSNIKSIFKSTGKKFPAFVSFGNAQQLPLQDNSVDLIVTSPPYASNAIDYMRAHKFSLVWFGYPIGKLSKKRRTYIGSDYVTDYEFLDLPSLPRKVISDLQKVNSKKSQALYRYYVEIQAAIREMNRVLRPGKPAVIVVGNSILSGVDAQVSECLAEIGQNAGMELVRINIRRLDRNKRMLPAGNKINLESQIQQRMHEEYVIGFLKPED
jgi:DNA modification methylase